MSASRVFSLSPPLGGGGEQLPPRPAMRRGWVGGGPAAASAGRTAGPAGAAARAGRRLRRPAPVAVCGVTARSHLSVLSSLMSVTSFILVSDPFHSLISVTSLDDSSETLPLSPPPGSRPLGPPAPSLSPSLPLSPSPQHSSRRWPPCASLCLRVRDTDKTRPRPPPPVPAPRPSPPPSAAA